MVDGRSKGACIVLGFQDLPGLKEVYGDNIAFEILGNCGNKVFLNNDDSETIRYASNHFKTQEVEETRVSSNSSSSFTTSKAGGSSSSLSGYNVQKKRLTRPVVNEGELKSLGRPKEGVRGINGFADTASVGADSPYKFYLESDSIIKNLTPKDEMTSDFEGRARKDLELEDWTEEDLERLNLLAEIEKIEDISGSKWENELSSTTELSKDKKNEGVLGNLEIEKSNNGHSLNDF